MKFTLASGFLIVGLLGWQTMAKKIQMTRRFVGDLVLSGSMIAEVPPFSQFFITLGRLNFGRMLLRL